MRTCTLAISCGLCLLSACGDLFGPGDRPNGLWIGQTGLVLTPGDTARLTASAMETRTSMVLPPRDASWSSDDTSVVEVHGNGRVRAVAPGRTTVWVIAGARRDSATVVVRGEDEAPEARWHSVDVGGAGHACALSEAGRAYCWGSDYYGGLGNGVRRQWTVTLAPAAVTGGHGFAEIAAGSFHVCGRTDAGDVYCWGENQTGATGSGSEHPRMLFEPNRVSFSEPFTRLAAATDNTAAMTADGSVFTWGRNDSGQIGDGAAGPLEIRTDPTPLKTDQRFSSVNPGGRYACALTFEGVAWCWGDNFGDHLGLGAPDRSHQLTPHPVLQGELRFESLSEGGGMCGLTKAGEAYCWGSSVTRMVDEPATVSTHPPRPVPGAPAFARLFSGTASECGLTPGGEALCWGWNEHGELGTGEPLEESCGRLGSSDVSPCTSRPVPVAGGHRFRQLSSAGGTTCGVTLEGALYCWGTNYDGQLGNGSSIEGSPVPVRVADPL